MKTSELVKLLTEHPEVTDTEAYNLLVDDLFQFVPEDVIASPGGQRLIAYFQYKITEVCLPVIKQVRANAAPAIPPHGGETEKIKAVPLAGTSPTDK